MRTWHSWLVVAVFAAAMAWVEAAVVLDLRTMVDRIDPYQPDPLPLGGKIGRTELVREAATLMMLASVGWLAGRTLRSRVGYAAMAFGVWDILYYAFLRILTGWPKSVLDWDILFLLPLPWWGPVLAPVLISMLLIVWGMLVALIEARDRVASHSGWTVAAGATGVALSLYVFMADALRVVGGGESALRQMLPEAFDWPVFACAIGLMAVPVIELALKCGRLEYER